MRKAEAEIISLALIVILTLIFIGLTYTWLYPWIERKSEEIKVERLLGDFNPANPRSLPRKIESVTKEGGEVSFRISTKGIWKIYPSEYPGPENNSLEFFTFSKAITGELSVGKWRSFSEDVTCPPPTGRVGEIPYVVCFRAEPHGEGHIITFRLMFRELEENAIRGSKISLEKWTSISPDTSTSEIIKIKREDIYQKLVDSKTIIITEIKILL